MRASFLRFRIDPVILGLALFNVAIHLLFINNLEYHRDELLYFSLGQHPAFGYATVPPLIGWIAWLMKSLLGYSLFAVRLFPAILSGLIIIVIAEIAKELGGSRYSSILASTGMIVSIFGLRTFFLFQPVHTDLFFWTLSIYLIIKYVNTSSDKFLVLFGILSGVALLNKYLIGLLFFWILVILPFTQLKMVFNNRKFWTGLILGAIIFLPNLIWQIIHGFPVTGHLTELERTQLVNVDRIEFLVAQLYSPGIASLLTITGLLYLFINKNAVKFRFLGIISVLVIITLMLLRGKSYYTQGLFPFLIAAGAVYAENILRKTWSQIMLITLLVILALPAVPFGLPIFNSKWMAGYFKRLEVKYGINLGRQWEDRSIHSLPQDYADMLGWEELTAIANKAYQMVPDKKACFIYCENYGQAGAITVIGKKYGLPEAVCFSESFRYWIPRKFDPDPTCLVYINDKPGNDIRELFSEITKVGSISNPDAREFGNSVYLCEDPKYSFNEFWTRRLERLFNPSSLH